MDSPERMSPLQTRLFSVDGISLTPKPEGERVVLRADRSALAKINKALAFSLPKTPKTSTGTDGMVALWIGPDEWLLLGVEGSGIVDKLTKVKSDLICAVDVSHRNTAIEISGPLAVSTLNSGCPQDLGLDQFPVSAVSRTLFGKAEIVLYRTGPDAFHLECWRSFSDYMWKFLVDAAKSA